MSLDNTLVAEASTKPVSDAVDLAELDGGPRT